MRISKRWIKRVANEKLREKGRITQIEIHEEIERRLGRELTHGEKIRITLVLKNEYLVENEERDKENGQRIYLFM